MWSRRQVLQLGSAPRLDPEVSGLCFSPNGEAMYVGLQHAVARFDLGAQSRCSFPLAEYS